MDLVAVPITTTGDVKKNLGLVHRRRPDKLQGYCECCHVKYKDMNQHVKEDDHQSFARDKSNFESLDALIKQIPSTSQFLQEILLRHCVQKQVETASHNCSNGSKELSAKLDTDLLPVMSPIPSEATPHATESLALSAKPYAKSPNISKGPCEPDFNDCEDTRPHAVVIRRRTPSGAFVSPRRREPTPSKRPWLQERFMVFRDSPMASLQPSGMTSAINDLSLPNISQNLNDSLARSCDPLKYKSIVRSLIDMPDFISSPLNTSETDRLSVNNTEEVKPNRIYIKPDHNLTNSQEVNSHCTELSNVTSVNLTPIEPLITLDHVEESGGMTHCDEPPDFKLSPDVFVPCIADRVKRRSRTIEPAQLQDSKSTKNSQNVNSADESLGHHKNTSKDHSTQHINLRCQERLNSNENNSSFEKLMSDSLAGGNIEKSNDGCDAKKSGNELVTIGTKEHEESLEYREAQETNDYDGVDEISNISHTKGRKTRKQVKCTDALQVPENHVAVDSKSPNKSDGLNEEPFTHVTPQNKGSLDTARKSKYCEKKSRRKKSCTIDATPEMPNSADTVMPRARQCKLFVHEGFYADDKIVDEFESLSNLPPPKKFKSESKPKQKSQEEILSDDRSCLKADEVKDENSVLEKSAKLYSSFELRLSRITETGKRMFKGKAIQADWDLKKENEKEVIDQFENDKRVTVGIGESVKRRRSCTFFNHIGQYANSGEGGDGVEDALCKIEHSSASQSLLHDHHSEALHPAVVLRRHPLSRSSLTKADKTWFKFMSKTDWTQFEDDVKLHEGDELSEECNFSVFAKPTPTITSLSPRSKYTSHPIHHLTHSKENSSLQYVACPKDSQSPMKSFGAAKWESQGSPSVENCGSNFRLKANKKDGRHLDLSSVAHDKASIRSPRLKLKIKRDVGSDCYSSTLEELHEENDAGSKSQETSAGQNLLGTPNRLSNELSPVNNTHSLDRSDSIDLLLTPRRHLKNSHSSGKISSAKSLRLSRSPISPMKLSLSKAKGRNLPDVPVLIDDDYLSTSVCERQYQLMESPLSKTECKKSKRKFSDAGRETELHQVIKKTISVENDHMSPPVCNRNYLSMESPDLNLKTKKRKRQSSNAEREAEPDQEQISAEYDCLSSEVYKRKDPSTKSSGSKLKRKKKQKLLDAKRGMQQNQFDINAAISDENNVLHQKELRESQQPTECAFDYKPKKRQKRDIDQTYTINSPSKEIEMKSPMKRKSMKSPHCSVSVCDTSSVKSENIPYRVPEKVDSLKPTSSEPEMACETLHPHKNASKDTELKPLIHELKCHSKKKRRKLKRKHRLSDEDIEVSDSKRPKSTHVSSENNTSLNLLRHTPEKVAKSPLTRNKSMGTGSREVNDKLGFEPSIGNVGDLFFVPNFSSPGKTNSSWDDACDSYLNKSSKSNELTSGAQSSSMHPAGTTVMWSPFKLNSPQKSSKNNFQSKNESCKSDHNSFSSTHFVFSNTHSGFVTPTKRSNSLCHAASPSVEKVDSVISFNHMSPQRLHFSPLKLKSPIRNLEKSPGNHRLNCDVTFNGMSPHRLTFSPSKHLSA